MSSWRTRRPATTTICCRCACRPWRWSNGDERDRDHRGPAGQRKAGGQRVRGKCLRAGDGRTAAGAGTGRTARAEAGVPPAAVDRGRPREDGGAVTSLIVRPDGTVTFVHDDDVACLLYTSDAADERSSVDL